MNNHKKDCTTTIPRLEIRTVEDDPHCLRVFEIYHPDRPQAQKLIDLICAYYREIGSWPTLEQIKNAIDRFSIDSKLDS